LASFKQFTTTKITATTADNNVSKLKKNLNQAVIFYQLLNCLLINWVLLNLLKYFPPASHWHCIQYFMSTWIYNWSSDAFYIEQKKTYTVLSLWAKDLHKFESISDCCRYTK